MPEYQVTATKIETELTKGPDDVWPDLTPDRTSTGLAAIGLRPGSMTVYHVLERDGVQIVVNGQNIRRDGSLGARTSRCYSTGRYGAEPPAWVQQIADEVGRPVAALRALTESETTL